MTRIVNGEIIRDDEEGGDPSSSSSQEQSQTPGAPRNGNLMTYCSEKISFFGYKIPKYSIFFIGFLTLLLFGFNGLFGLGLLAGCHYLYSNTNGNSSSASTTNSTGYQPVNRGNGKSNGGGARIATIKDLPKPPPSQ